MGNPDGDLLTAAARRDAYLVREALANGANVNCEDMMEKGANPLLHAVFPGANPAVVQVLLENGANPNCHNLTNTAVGLAARDGNLEVVKLLVEHGADPRVKGPGGDDAFSWAECEGHMHILDYLASLGSSKKQQKWGQFKRKAGNPATLPRLSEETHLHKMFGEPTTSPTPGKGGKYMDELVTYWNKSDYDKSLKLLNAAISAGLEGYDKSTAHCLRGQIYIRHGNLPSAIDDFLECLALPDRAMDYTWQATKRLEYIYSEAMRSSEAEKLGSLSRLANKMNWTHTPNVESELREMTRKLINNGKLNV